MPRATAAERDARDTLVLQLFLAGVPYRKIGQRTNLSPGGVHKAVQRQLALGAQRRNVLQDNALDVYRERLEDLFARSYTLASDTTAKPEQKLKALETTRRYLDMMGRLDGVATDLATLPPPPPAGDDDDEDEDGGDELAAFRKRARGA